MTRAEHVRARRKVAQRVGLAAIVLLTALNACIFDQGDGYQGGGRKNNGGTVTTATDTTTATSPTSTDTATDDAGDQIPGLDAASADAG